MTTTSAKRINRSEETHAPTKTAGQTDTLSDDLTARLQNVGSRVRKSVMEGYVTDRSASASTSPHPSPTKPKPGPPPEALIFQSANDTLRNVYASLPLGGYRAPQALNKRAWSEEPNDNTNQGCGDIEMHASDSGAGGSSLPSFAGSDTTHGKPRLVKPLKKPGRRLVQTQSLPVGALQFSNDLEPGGWLPDLATKASDDDWSDDPYFDTTMKPIHDMDF